MVVLLITGIISIIIGIIILIWPKILNLAVAFWFLIWGILMVLAYYNIIPLSISINPIL
jgi:hypothetical protein